MFSYGLFLWDPWPLYLFPGTTTTDHHELGGLKPQVLEAQSPRSWCRQGHARSEGFGGRFLLPRPASGGSWHSLAHRFAPPIPASSVLRFPLAFRRTLVGYRAHLDNPR